MAGTVLVGDIGGTNVRLASARRTGEGSLCVDRVEVMAGEAYDDFDGALSDYLNGAGTARFDGALFAFAGPVRDNAITMTNRDWTVRAKDLSEAFNLGPVHLVNDYAAMARSVPELPAESFHQIHAGDPPHDRAPILVSGPGTGLGVATLVPAGETGWITVTGEGGHAAFAPETDREWALAKALQAEHGYVSKELVVSGIGLDAVHKALCQIHGVQWEKTSPQQLMDAAELGPGIARDICEIRARTTMSALADMALSNGTTGGVVITGGVAQRLVRWLEAPESLARFFERTVQKNYLSAMPISVLQSGHAALIGAAALYFDAENAS